MQPFYRTTFCSFRSEEVPIGIPAARRLTKRAKSGINSTMRILSCMLVVSLLWVGVHEAAAHATLAHAEPDHHSESRDPTSREGHCPDGHDHESHCYLNNAAVMPGAVNKAKDLSPSCTGPAHHVDTVTIRQDIVIAPNALLNQPNESSPLYLRAQSLLL